VESNQSFFNSASNFLNELNALFYGQENPYTAQDLWNLVGTNGAVSLQVLGLLIQALQTANPEYVAPVIPDQLTPNADGTVTDTQPIN